MVPVRTSSGLFEAPQNKLGNYESDGGKDIGAMTSFRYRKLMRQSNFAIAEVKGKIDVEWI